MHADCYHKMYINEEHHWWFKSRVKIVKDLLRNFSISVADKKILDAGCGTSFLSKSITNNPDNVFNVDNCDISLDYSKRRGMVNVINGDLLNLPFEKDWFDFCVCMDVIEHNSNDAELVHELARVIKKDGIIITAVPATKALWGPQDEKLGHFRRYEKNEFAKLFQEDFEILKISYFNTLLFPAVYIMRKIFNIAPIILKEKDELDMNNKFFNGLLYRIFSFEGNLLKYFNFPAGVSLIVVGRKKI